MNDVNIKRAIETVADVFQRFTLPPDIRRMTFHEPNAIGVPYEVMEYLELNYRGEYFDDDAQLFTLALLTRLCTLEDQIERGELKPAVNKWISVDERLPTEEDKYLVAIKDGSKWNITMRRFKIASRGWHIGRGYWERNTGGVRYWMEKPEAPEEVIV